MMTVLITGASSGIGAGLAKSWADDGCHVIACGRNPERLEQLRQSHANVTVRLFDMTDKDACRRSWRTANLNWLFSAPEPANISRPRLDRCREG